MAAGRALEKLVLPIKEVAKLAELAGWRGEDVVTAVAIAKAESGFNSHAIGDIDLREKGERSVGLWQINWRPSRDGVNDRFGRGGHYRVPGDKTRDPKANLNPSTNAHNAYAISEGGKRFSRWTTYTNGKYKQHLSAARQAAEDIGSVRRRGRPSPVGPATTAPRVGPDTGLPVLTLLPVYELPEKSGPIPVRTGDADAGELGNAVIGGSVDLTSNLVSEIRLDLLDGLDLALTRRYDLTVGTGVRFRDFNLQVQSLETSDHRGGAKVVLRCHPVGAVRLRTSVPSPVQSLNPTQYMAYLARLAGLRFVGEPMTFQDFRKIEPKEIDRKQDGLTVKRMQTAWEIAKELAAELGFLFFEAAGTLYFGTPLYLARQGAKVQVSWNGFTYPPLYGPVVRALQIPSCQAGGRRYTKVTDGYIVDQLRDVTIRAVVEREEGMRLRPSMNLTLGGVPPFDGAGRVITKVSWSLDDLHSPVTVEARSIDTFAQRTPSVSDSGIPDAPTGPYTAVPAADAPARTGGNQPRRIGNTDRARLFGPAGDSIRYSTYVTPWGIKVRVHQMVLPRFAAACEHANRQSKWRPRQIGSYNNRFIKNTQTKSLHAWALAWDFFDVPFGAPIDAQGTKNAPDAAFRNAFKEYGFYLGFEFTSNFDAPHIEWAGTPPLPPPPRPPGAGGPQA